MKFESKYKTKLLNILDQYGYLVSVLSAMLVLFSWFGKEVISGNLREAQKKLAVIVADRQDDRMDDILLHISNVEKDLMRAEHRELDRAEDPVSGTDYFAPVIWSTNTLDRIQIQRGDYSKVVERIDRLKSKAQGTPMNAKLEQRLATLVETVHFGTSQLKTFEEEYAKEYKNVMGLLPISRANVPREKVDPLVAAIMNYSHKTKQLLDTYLDRMNEMLKIREEIYRTAKEREALLDNLAIASSIIAALIFILGSTLGIYGTYRAAKMSKSPAS
jgi:hypothetical protein